MRRRRRPPRPDRADADDECVHPLRRAQSLLELAAGHHIAQARSDHPEGGPRLFHQERLRPGRSIRTRRARPQPDVRRLESCRRRPRAGQTAAAAWASKFDGEDEVHVPQSSRESGFTTLRRGKRSKTPRGSRATAAFVWKRRRGFERWLFNGRPPNPKGAKPEQKVNLPTPVPLYITYLTAVPSGTSIVYFDDFYGKDRAQARQFAGL